MIAAISILMLSPMAVGGQVFGLDWADEVRSGPIVGGMRTREVRYTTVTGTGMSEHSTALLQRHGGSYRVLWTHSFLEISNNLGAESFRVRYRWRYEPETTRMIVTGTRSVGGSFDLRTGYGSARRIEQLPREAFCYSSRLRKFDRCLRP